MNEMSQMWAMVQASLGAPTLAPDAGTLDMTEFEEKVEKETPCDAEEVHPCGPVTHRVRCLGCGDNGFFCMYATMGRLNDMKDPWVICENCEIPVGVCWVVTPL